VLHAVLTQYRRVTDGQTDGIAVASTALAMRALRRAVKPVKQQYLLHMFLQYGELRSTSG